MFKNNFFSGFSIGKVAINCEIALKINELITMQVITPCKSHKNVTWLTADLRQRSGDLRRFVQVEAEDDVAVTLHLTAGCVVQSTVVTNQQHVSVEL